MSEEIVCPISCVKSGCPDPADFLEKHSTFMITISGIISAFLGGLLSYFLKSRCTKIKTPCCSCDREVLQEIEIKSPKKEKEKE